MARSTNDLDNEWRKLRPQIIKQLGDKCIYCGKKATNYHHIVPKHMGGDNRIQNIVPLCAECHKKAHSKRSGKKQTEWGRKPLPKPANFNEVIDKYLECDFSLAEALERTGLKRHTFYKFLDEYYKETGDTRRHQDKGIVRDGRGIV